MNPRRLTPSMSLLLAFEAAARHLSFTRAADELAATQSAISKQVQALEELVGVELFVRTGRKIALTDVGAMYQRELANHLAGIRNATLQAIAFRNGSGTLHLAALPTFASKWLLPRLHSFYASHAQVELHVHSRIGQIDTSERSGMDAFIAVGDGQWTGCNAHLLQNEELVPIISPKALTAAPICNANDLASRFLLRITARPETWKIWLQAQHVDCSRLRYGPTFELTSHLIQAAIAGIGVGLVPRFFVEEELRAGTLAIALHATVPSNLGYYLVYPTQRATYPPLVQFQSWLIESIRQESPHGKAPNGVEAASSGTASASNAASGTARRSNGQRAGAAG